MEITRKTGVIFVIFSFLVGYVAYILFVNFKAEVQRYSLLSELFATEASHIKRQTEFVLNAHKQLLENLAKDREITGYFANKRMGMSEAYGLLVSKIEATKALSEQSCKTDSYQPCFTDLAILDNNRTAILGSGDMELLENISRHLLSSHDLMLFPTHQRLCGYKDIIVESQHEGYVIGCVSTRRLLEEFRHYVGIETKLVQLVVIRYPENKALTFEYKEGIGWDISCPRAVADNSQETIELQPLSYQFSNHSAVLKVYPQPVPRGIHSLVSYILGMGALICLISIGIAWRQLIDNLSELNLKLSQKAKEAEEASQAKTKYVSYISHEIRTPLNYMLGYAQVMLQDPAIPEEKKPFLNAIVQGGRLITQLINEVLDIAKLEAGVVEIKHEAFDLKSCFKEIEETLGFGALQKGVKVSFVHSWVGNGSVWLYGDKLKIQQILINLLGNAVKLTPAGKEVKVESKVEEVGDGKVKLTMAVQDSGPGLTPEEKERIFLPFYQTDGGIKAGGTGLGLYYVYKLVSVMDGGVSVESEVGKGTCIQVELIVDKASPPEADKPPSDALVTSLLSSVPPLKILICDDDPQMRSVLKLWCENAGFITEEAKDGKSLFEKIDAFKPDVILLDIVLPDMDGIECLRRIRLNTRWSSVKVLLLTGKAYEGYEKRAMDEGADGFLMKPVEFQNLIETVISISGTRKTDSHVAPEAASKPTSGLPVELIEELKQLILKANLQAFVKKVEDFSDVIGADFARSLLTLAKEYRYQEIIESLDNLARREGRDGDGSTKIQNRG